MMVLRSMLFVPGNNMRMIIKAATLASDAIILDLEDAVPLPDKETARFMIRDTIKAIKSRGFSVFVRVNALTTELTAEDLKSVLVDGLDGIMLPKTEAGSDVEELNEMLDKAEESSGLKRGASKVIPLLEAAKAVINTYEIASANERVVAVAFGAGDYCRDLGLGRGASSLSLDQTELLYARSQIVNGSRAAGIQAIDTPFLGLLTDREDFMKEVVLASQLGFKGKMLIHPTQIEFVNKAFTPPQDEVGYAQRLVEAFEKARAEGLGAISFEGKMVDHMNYKQAKELLHLAELITERRERRKYASSVRLLDFFRVASRGCSLA